MTDTTLTLDTFKEAADRVKEVTQDSYLYS